jgi:hypothetical protein
VPKPYRHNRPIYLPDESGIWRRQRWWNRLLPPGSHPLWKFALVLFLAQMLEADKFNWDEIRVLAGAVGGGGAWAWFTQKSKDGEDA